MRAPVLLRAMDDPERDGDGQVAAFPGRASAGIRRRGKHRGDDDGQEKEEARPEPWEDHTRGRRMIPSDRGRQWATQCVGYFSWHQMDRE